MKPIAPVPRKVDCQPHFSAIHGTSRIVATAPMLAPELKIPVAAARCLLGNHSATVLMQAGKVAASPNPRNTPATPQKGAVVAAACIIAAALQTPTAMANATRVPNLSSKRPVPNSPMAYATGNADGMLPYWPAG